MGKLAKRQRKMAERIERGRLYSLDQALALLHETSTAKFDESIDLALRLGVDPRKPDQALRGVCDMPHGTGKKVRVLVFAKGPQALAAEEAGADFVGAEELIAKINGGWLDFERTVATPTLMGQVGKIGKILGPRNLMPNPKTGTVTMEVAAAVKAIKSGQVAFKVERGGILHFPVGRASFSAEQLKENVLHAAATVRRLKPAGSKGNYFRSITLSPTMGRGIPLDPTPFAA